ncbi:MAG: hypothetical protein ACKOWF_02085 [Chloroflexota bacterium]
MIASPMRTETEIIRAVDLIVDELERALLDEDADFASELHAVLVGPGIPAAEREDRVAELGWRLGSEDRLLRRAS